MEQMAIRWGRGSRPPAIVTDGTGALPSKQERTGSLPPRGLGGILCLVRSESRAQEGLCTVISRAIRLNVTASVLRMAKAQTSTVGGGLMVTRSSDAGRA
jgi:hypothetical protein